MPHEANPFTVTSALIGEFGVKGEFAQRLVEKHADIVARGERLLSFAHYVAGEVLQAEGVDDNWDGWNPEYNEEEDYDEEEDEWEEEEDDWDDEEDAEFI